jgi:hypothetical protein
MHTYIHTHRRRDDKVGPKKLFFFFFFFFFLSSSFFFLLLLHQDIKPAQTEETGRKEGRKGKEGKAKGHRSGLLSFFTSLLAAQRERPGTR